MPSAPDGTAAVLKARARLAAASRQGADSETLSEREAELAVAKAAREIARARTLIGVAHRLYLAKLALGEEPVREDVRISQREVDDAR